MHLRLAPRTPVYVLPSFFVGIHIRLIINSLFSNINLIGIFLTKKLTYRQKTKRADDTYGAVGFIETGKGSKTTTMGVTHC